MLPDPSSKKSRGPRIIHTTGAEKHLNRGAKRAHYDFRTLLTYRLLVLSNKLGKGAMRLYAGRYDIPLAEWRLLAALALEAPSSVNGLAEALGADKGWVSRTAASLMSKGLVDSRDDPSDGRRMEIDLSQAGRALHARIVPAAIARQRRLVSVLSPAERRSLDRILEKLQRQADVLLEFCMTDREDVAKPPQPATPRKSTAARS